MKIKRPLLVMAGICVSTAVFVSAQSEPKIVNATAAILSAFRSHDLVMLGEIHGNRQEYDWLRDLVGNPKFADTVDDIVMEFGNSRYQQAVDRYLSGEKVPSKKFRAHGATASRPLFRHLTSTHRCMRLCAKRT